MTEPKFTLGPWKLAVKRKPWGKKAEESLCRIESLDGTLVSLTAGMIDRKERKANAHLIAAAPEMYHKLDGIAEWLEYVLRKDITIEAKDIEETIAEIRQLLKEARGNDV